MTRATDSGQPPANSAVPPAAIAQDGHVCPFCGLTREIADEFDPASPCPRCALADTPATRQATKQRIGPWHVRQVRNPWAPGMGFGTLLALIKRGQVTKDSIVRGPTTHQLWKRASEVKGLSREFGVCYSCGAQIGTQANLCPSCNRLQEPPVNPDVLMEGREPAGGSQPPATPAVEPTAPVAPAPVPPSSSSVRSPQPPSLDIGSAASDAMSPDDLFAADDETELARQITSRPPVAPSRPRPIRPVAPGTEDALLTPQELAQAFQLGLSQPGESRRGPTRKSAVAVILLLLVGGTIALLSLHADFRRATGQWLASAYATVQSWMGSKPSAPMTPTTQPTLAQATEPRPPAVIAPPVVIAQPTAPDAPPAAIETPVIPPASAPAVIAKADPPTVSEHNAKPAAEQLPADPEEQARTLWRKAIDAEINQDYVEAVRCYEMIKKLPADVQPWGLDVRLEQARKLAK